MGCAPCAQRAKERQLRMLEQLSEQAQVATPEPEKKDSTYVETANSSKYMEFKRKLYNQQALYNKEN